MKHSLKRSVSVLLAVLFVLLTLTVVAFAVPGDDSTDPAPCEHENARVMFDYSCLQGEGKTPYYLMYCNDCKETFRFELDEPADHVTEVQKGYDATCTKDGLSDGEVCTRCGEVTVEQVVNKATGHHDRNGDGWCDDDNVEMRYHCPICGKAHDGNFFDRVIIKFFHDVQIQIRNIFNF